MNHQVYLTAGTASKVKKSNKKHQALLVVLSNTTYAKVSSADFYILNPHFIHTALHPSLSCFKLYLFFNFLSTSHSSHKGFPEELILHLKGHSTNFTVQSIFFFRRGLKYHNSHEFPLPLPSRQLELCFEL